MQAFGIEIRKSGINNLYKDVDKTLHGFGIPKGSVNLEMKVQTIAHSLQKMMKADSYFSVCTIDNCIKVCNIIIPKDRMNIYSAAHCIYWNDMTPDYRKALIAMVLDDFRPILLPS